MNRIETCVLNPTAIAEAENMMVCAARLTQRGHTVKCMRGFMDLYEKEHTAQTVANLANLPHPTLQKFAVINVAVVGASRRFLAQITRHQNEVKFMSASLQYSERYKQLASADNDSAGYVTPQGLRNILIISATPYQWKHMIGQRICRRNTAETRYVMLKIWKELYELSPELFSGGCFCMTGGCKEGKMSCGKPISAGATPDEIIKADFPLLAGGFSGYENKID